MFQSNYGILKQVLSELFKGGKKETTEEPRQVNYLKNPNNKPINEEELVAKEAELSPKVEELISKQSSGRFKNPESGKQEDVLAWQKGNKIRDSLRSALAEHGYTPKDISTLSSNKDILKAHEMGWDISKLRSSGLLPYDPHKPSDIEIVNEKSLENPAVEPSIPKASTMKPLEKVKLNKYGLIILARRGKSKKIVPKEVEISGNTDKPIPLTRKRPKPFFNS